MHRTHRRLASFVVAVCALAAPAPALAQGGTSPTPAPGETSPFDGNAMWIWQMPRAERGNWAAIARRAKRNKITALYIKAADGGYNDWRQFTPAMVDYFQSQGLKVCGWHYIYGRLPGREANLSANVARDGADCFIIDAEAEYEGRYAAADEYITKLRAQVGDDYPIALAGFPYVDYHPSFPYSVFLRPDGGAQYNLPQMYWRAIGTTVDRVFSRTYAWNRIYGRPIFPLGQIWANPPIWQIRRFRKLAQAYGAAGVSWWEWTQAEARRFRAASKPLKSNAARRSVPPPTIRRGSRGDWVIWAQEHLNGAGNFVRVTGNFGPQTEAAVKAFQSSAGLFATGRIDPPTWERLLEATPVATRWSRRARRSASASSTRGGPATAGLPARRNELGTPKRR